LGQQPLAKNFYLSLENSASKDSHLGSPLQKRFYWTQGFAFYALSMMKMEHLLNTCPFKNSLWDQGALDFRQSNRNMHSVRSTISSWRDNSFVNPMLNHIWVLLPGFILWEIWKERNHQIFKEKAQPKEIIWHKIKQKLSGDHF
jgi:hypothetical protein